MVVFNRLDLTRKNDVDESKCGVIDAFNELCGTISFCLFIFKRYSFLVCSII